MSKYKKEQILTQFDSLSDFFRQLSNEADGRAVSGDCVSYAAAVYDTVYCDGLYGTFLPDVECADAPMHVVVIIDDQYYDGSGKTSKYQIIDSAYGIFLEDWDNRARRIERKENKTIKDHIKRQAGELERQWLDNYPNYDHEIYLSVKNTINSMIN